MDPKELKIPAQGLLDHLTRSDELLVGVQLLLNRLIGVMGGKPPHLVLPQEDIRNLYWGPDPKKIPYGFVGGPTALSMSAARTDEEFQVDGDILVATTDGTLDGVTVRFNSKSADPIPVKFLNEFEIPVSFNRIWVTHTVQTGKTLYLLLGREGALKAKPQVSEVTSRQTFLTLRSDKDSHFTGTIAQNAIEAEDLTGLVANKIRITGISIQAEQALDFYLMLWDADSFADADLDDDAFIGMVRCNLASHGKQIGGTAQYYLSIEGLDLDYWDADESKELHVSLFNNSATGKLASASGGEVVIEIRYEVRA